MTTLQILAVFLAKNYAIPTKELLDFMEEHRDDTEEDPYGEDGP